MGMAVKEYFKMAKEMSEYLILIPFIPVLVIIMWILGKGLEVNSKIPEDLDEQEEQANKNGH